MSNDSGAARDLQGALQAIETITDDLVTAFHHRLGGGVAPDQVQLAMSDVAEKFRLVRRRLNRKALGC